MKIQVIPSLGEINNEPFDGTVVIVIDVLRATSAMITALAYGASSVIPVEKTEEAEKLRRPGVLLGGERSCRIIPGFDLGNSPFEYQNDIVQGKRIIMTTTNGTRAVQRAGAAKEIITGAFLNGRAAARKAVLLGVDIVILCAGTRDVFALEDGLCAGKIAMDILSQTERKGMNSEINDFGRSMIFAYERVKDRLADALLKCQSGQRLTRLGFQHDVHYCAREDLYDFAPAIVGGQLLRSSLETIQEF